MGSGKSTRELELKLTGNARDMPAFKRAVDAATSERHRWQSDDMATRYFDTPEHRLFKKGIALRVRQAKGTFLQTIKAERGGGALDRSEWEQPVTDAEPDLNCIPKAVRRKIGRLSDGALHPMIAVDVRRQKTIIRRPSPEGPDLEVEAVVDRGLVQAGERSQRFSECELELLQGDPAEFFRLVSEIHAACPLRLSRTTKSDRGYALLKQETSSAVKMPKLKLQADRSVNAAIGMIFERCIANIIDNEAAALDGSDPEGVHQLRVSVRRLRSSLSLFRDYIDPGRAAALDGELKWLASSFGAAREWDVFATETLPAVSGYGIDPSMIKALERPVRALRRAGYGLVRATLNSERYAKLVMRLTAFAATEAWTPDTAGGSKILADPLSAHAPDILEKPYRKLRKAGKGLKRQLPEQRHRVRIKLKKLRYAVDFLGGLYDNKDARPFLARLRQLQDEFGHLNDVAQTSELASKLVRPPAGLPKPSDRAKVAAGTVLGWHANELRAIERPLLKNWSKFKATQPPWQTEE